MPVAVLVAAVAALVLIFAGSRQRHYTLLFENAGQLVKGDRVRIGGTPAGSISGIDLAENGQAAVSIDLDRRFGPLREGTTAIVRQIGLTSVAGRYVDVSPGPTFRPALDDGATIASEDTTSIVDLDQVFNALDPSTRKGLQQLIGGSASWYEGKEGEANAAAEAFPAALSGLSGLAAELSSDDANLTRMLTKTGDAFAALTENREQLTDLVSNTRATAAALSEHTESLDQALRHVAPALRNGTETFIELRPALRELRKLVDVSGPATKDLAPFARELRPVLERAVPTFSDLRKMFAQAGADNDLLDALKDLPALDRLSESGFAEGEKALKDSTPVFSFARPYVPDLVGWVRNFGQAMAPYDANGHYARTLAVFDAYTSPDGVTLTPKPASERGRDQNLTTGQLRRCPGSATAPLPDRSAPFVDDGPLTNADCDASQVPGGSR